MVKSKIQKRKPIRVWWHTVNYRRSSAPKIISSAPSFIRLSDTSMAISDSCIKVLALQMVGEMILDDDVLFHYLGEDFVDSMDVEDMENLQKAMHTIAARCIKASAGKYVGIETHDTFKSWSNQTVLKAHDKGNLQ